jgi:lipopolysaccharide biosynthesis glycosyltransferase
LLTLLSAATRSTASTVCLIVGDDLNPDAVAQARKLFQRYRVPFRYVEGDFSELDHLPLSNHLSRTTYGRLLIPAAATEFAPTTLYLDADTLTVGDVAPLVRLTLEQHAIVAAVPSRDIPTCASLGGVRDWRERGFGADDPFFNAGVLLIDNSRWLEHDISGSVLAELTQKPDAASFADQGILNSLLHGRWAKLSWVWNHEVVRTPNVRIGSWVIARRSHISLRDARILHFLADVKPWQPEYPPGYFRRRYRREWQHFLRSSPPEPEGYVAWMRRRYGHRL